MALLSNSTAKNFNFTEDPNEPKLLPDAVKKLLPVIEAYIAKDKNSQTLMFIKKFKDFKQGSPEFKACVMM